MVYERRRGRGCRPRSIGRRTLGQAGDARCGARTAGARALWPRWQGGGASGRWTGLRQVSSYPTTLLFLQLRLMARLFLLGPVSLPLII